MFFLQAFFIIILIALLIAGRSVTVWRNCHNTFLFSEFLVIGPAPVDRLVTDMRLAFSVHLLRGGQHLRGRDHLPAPHRRRVRRPQRHGGRGTFGLAIEQPNLPTELDRLVSDTTSPN